jgi:hypothetical protein
MNVLPLRTLLATHDRFSAPHALPRALGDGFLYAFTPPFAAARDLALEYGYEYVEQESELWHDYQAIPLLSLRTILERKAIPYFDNVSVLRRLSESRPDLRLPGRLIYESLKRNHVFHETCHCIAHERLREHPEVFQFLRSADERFVMDSIMQEASANAAERVLSMLPPSPSYAFFWNLNTYMPYAQKHREFCETLARELSQAQTFELAFFRYLGLNLQVPKEELRDVIAAAAPRQIGPETLDQMLNKEFTLSETFVNETTRAYFVLYGAEAALDAVRTAKLTSNDAFVDAAWRFARAMAALLWREADRPEDGKAIGQASVSYAGAR